MRREKDPRFSRAVAGPVGHDIRPARQHLAQLDDRTETSQEFREPRRDSIFADSIRPRIPMRIHTGQAHESLKEFDNGARFGHAPETFAKTGPSGQPQFHGDRNWQRGAAFHSYKLQIDVP
jgi:hypothetical protein